MTMGFKENLRQLIDEQGISAYRLAQKIGVEHTVVRNWLYGRAKLPRADTFIKLANFFEVEPESLLTDLKEVPLSDRMLMLARKLQEYYEKEPEDGTKLIEFIEIWVGGKRRRGEYSFSGQERRRGM